MVCASAASWSAYSRSRAAAELVAAVSSFFDSSRCAASASSSSSSRLAQEKITCIQYSTKSGIAKRSWAKQKQKGELTTEPLELGVHGVPLLLHLDISLGRICQGVVEGLQAHEFSKNSNSHRSTTKRAKQKATYVVHPRLRSCD